MMRNVGCHSALKFFVHKVKLAKGQSGLKILPSKRPSSSSQRLLNFAARGCSAHSTWTHPSAVSKSLAHKALSAMSPAVSKSICLDTDNAQATFPTSNGFNVLKCSLTAWAKALKSSSSCHWSIANAHSTQPRSWAHMCFSRCFGPQSISCAASFMRLTSLHQTLANDHSSCDRSKFSKSAILPRAWCATAAKSPSW